jgi:hypothetical protein
MRCVLRRGAVIFLMDDLGPPSAKTRSHQRQLQAKTETRPLISQSEIRATVVSGDTQATGHKMKRFLLLPAAVTLALTSAATVPAQAGCGYGPTLLWSAASVCGAGAILLLDARRAGVGRVSRCMGVPQRSSL